jgi:hypothetical protein
VSQVTKMLAGRVEGARFESVGELELKGIPEPVEAFAVVWEPLADESGVQVGTWPLPPVLRSVPRAPYVGRADERALMNGSRAQARAGARQVVLLAGEPGIGKTSWRRMRRCARMPRVRGLPVRAARTSRRRTSRGSSLLQLEEHALTTWSPDTSPRAGRDRAARAQFSPPAPGAHAAVL